MCKATGGVHVCLLNGWQLSAGLVLRWGGVSLQSFIFTRGEDGNVVVVVGASSCLALRAEAMAGEGPASLSTRQCTLYHGALCTAA